MKNILRKQELFITNYSIFFKKYNFVFFVSFVVL